MDPAILEISSAANGDLVFIPKVPLNQQTVQGLWREIRRALAQHPPNQVVFDFRDVPVMDSAGLALLQALQEHCGERGIDVRHQGGSVNVKRFLAFLDVVETVVVPAEILPREHWIARLGGAFRASLQDAREMVSFSGSVVTAMARLFTQRATLPLARNPILCSNVWRQCHAHHLPD